MLTIPRVGGFCCAASLDTRAVNRSKKRIRFLGRMMNLQTDM